MDTIVNLAKARGFVFAGSEIYGGMANSWDYGPLGVELKRNIVNAWWQRFVTSRGDMVGIDAAVIMNPRVWEASGHVEGFTDPLVECKKCHERFRADQINVTKSCARCGAKDGFTEPKNFNLLFKTFIGSTEDSASVAYLRGELAQAMFVDLPQVLMTSRKRIPFGIAQQGKCFRNEITPGNFIFRTREFNLMEFEYFVRESEWEKWFEYWVKEAEQWFIGLGIKNDHLRRREQKKEELAHYAKRTIDLEYHWPFGKEWDELTGIANRQDFDLKAHGMKENVPFVIEPSFGVERAALAFLLDAFDEIEGGRTTTTESVKESEVVMRLDPRLSPVKVAVLPLSKKEPLSTLGQEIAATLRTNFTIEYDETQSIGKRYRRQDEIGTPWCVTVDVDSLEDGAVTIRDRDSMTQERVGVDQVKRVILDRLAAVRP